MKPGLLACLVCVVLAACGTSAPTPIATPAPTQTVGAQPSTPQPASPTIGPSAAPSAAPTPTGTPVPPEALTGTELAPSTGGPPGRLDHTWTIVNDSAYLFGGRTADGPANDLWAFDLATDEWRELNPGGTPPAPRFGHTATWVPNVGLVVWSGEGDGFFDDLWAYDPAADTWRELPSVGAVPEARYGSCASLGPDGRLWISHGFTQDDGRFADTRAHDFATGEWTDMTPSGDLPVKRCLHDCYWSDAGKLILYGGQTTGVSALGDIWSYDPQAQTWLQGPQPLAAPRQLYALASGGPDALVFGGRALDGGFLADTWRIDPADLTLTAQSIAGAAPAARSGATLLADPSRNRTLLFGGQGDAGMLDDVWELSIAP